MRGLSESIYMLVSELEYLRNIKQYKNKQEAILKYLKCLR